MMKLRHSWTSPFVRKVMITAWETGQADKIAFIPTSPLAAETDLGRDNPLHKIPALIREDGMVLYDSPVICEYLDSLHDTAPLFPREGEARWFALRLQALGDGIMDAAVARRLETTQRPPVERSPKWIERWKGVVERALAGLEGDIESLGGDVTIGHVAVAAALSYVDFRFADEGWRSMQPKLAAWYDAFARRPSMVETEYRG